ncbi:hypothetical protein NHX12_026166 [Muraenolepis orangiensis]|uniref:Uncharacterized protein n=1 Tax=Muraenolepis orangiensis TaxID=630683 RepID=A0A9Q0EG13_9TELE|nr:hypothetical protein NHX12_026166 [Muraenolepis orangiensis]
MNNMQTAPWSAMERSPGRPGGRSKQHANSPLVRDGAVSWTPRRPLQTACKQPPGPRWSGLLDAQEGLDITT